MRCTHCNIDYPQNALKCVKNDKNQTLYFCCNGCESVYNLLQSANLSSFYAKRADHTLTPIDSIKGENLRNLDSENLAYFDSPSFEQKFITQKGDIASVSLILEHIHCSACIWLNEQILNSQTGIKSAQINYTNNKLLLKFDKSKIKLSSIIALIRSIGYDAFAYDPSAQEQQNSKAAKSYYTRLIVGIFCTMNIMWLAVAQYSGYFLGMDDFARNVLNFASFLLCSATLFYSGFVFYRGAYFGLKNGFIGMDLLVATGASLTYIYSIYAALTGAGETYFESITMIITFVLSGKFLEVKCKKSAGDGLEKLNAFLPKSVSVVLDSQNADFENFQNLKTKNARPEDVKLGDVILALPGEKIALDGVLLSPNGIFDTKAINGESQPLEVEQNQEITSGFVNLSNRIFYRATRIFEDSMISKIVNLVEHSLSSKPEIQNLANSISQNFSRSILSIALLCFMGWYVLGDVGGEKSLVIAISVIIIACPCALALATPIASIVGISQAYKHSVLFKEAKFLEKLAKSSVAIFDKTGTLTQGKPQVVGVYGDLQNLDSENLSALFSLTSLSLHPISQGVKDFLSVQNLKAFDLQDFKQIDAKGLETRVQGRKILGGSLEFLAQNGVKITKFKDFEKLQNLNGSIFAFGVDERLLCVFELQDELKAGARELVEFLDSVNVKCVILSGDRAQNVSAIAQKLGIDEFYSNFDPLQKAAFVDDLRKNGAVVAMVGDGINDALALSKSDVSLSMGNGSDIALLSSDCVIINDSLDSVKAAFALSRRTYAAIRQNIILSICYNALTIPIALAGLIIPLFAALSMSFSSVLVVLNSLRIKNFRI